MSDAEPLEPFLSHVFKESWEVFKEDPVLYIVAALIQTLLGVFTLGLLLGPLYIGMVRIIAARRRGEAAGIGDIFGMAEWGAGIVAFILIAIGVIVGSIFLILPGIAFALFASLTFHAIALDDDGAVDAIKTSFGVIKDNFANVFVLMLLLTVLSMVGSVVWIGSLVTAPFTAVAMTVAYQRMTQAAPVAGELSAASGQPTAQV